MSDLEKLKKAFNDIGANISISEERSEINKALIFTYIDIYSYHGIDSVSCRFSPCGEFISID